MQAKATGGSWSAGGRQPEPECPPPTRASGDSSRTCTSPAFTYRRTYREMNRNSMHCHLITAEPHKAFMAYKVYLLNSGLSLFLRHVGVDTGCFQFRRNPRELRRDHIVKAAFTSYSLLRRSVPSILETHIKTPRSSTSDWRFISI